MEHDGAVVMKVKDVARYLGVHPTTVYRLLKDRALPAFRVGSDWRFTRDAIDDWIRGQIDDAAPEPK
jgi:excisionase family DNA binding protein